MTHLLFLILCICHGLTVLSFRRFKVAGDQLPNHVVGGLSARFQLIQYVVVEGRREVVFASEFQPEFVRVGKGDALLRFRKGDAGA